MTHGEKVAYMLKDLGQKGIGQYMIAPPIYRLLWRLGVEVKPPHFASFWSLVVPLGMAFGVFWGVIMWFFIWRQSTPVSVAVGTAMVAGLLFGIIMAVYYRGRARKLGLPKWADYPPRGR